MINYIEKENPLLIIILKKKILYNNYIEKENPLLIIILKKKILS
jgi:hypothetical protein